MSGIRWMGWRRDVLVGALSALATAAVLVPTGWAAVRDQRGQREVERDRVLEEARLAGRQAEAERDAARQAERLARQQADEARALAQRRLIDQAAQAIENLGIADGTEAEALKVATAAITPEVPQGCYLLLDKKARTFAVGDILVYRIEGSNYLGRVLAVDGERLTVARNGEAARSLSLRDVLGRGVMNTR